MWSHADHCSVFLLELAASGATVSSGGRQFVLAGGSATASGATQAAGSVSRSDATKDSSHSAGPATRESDNKRQ